MNNGNTIKLHTRILRWNSKFYMSDMVQMILMLLVLGSSTFLVLAEHWNHLKSVNTKNN